MQPAKKPASYINVRSTFSRFVSSWLPENDGWSEHDDTNKEERSLLSHDAWEMIALVGTPGGCQSSDFVSIRCQIGCSFNWLVHATCDMVEKSPRRGGETLRLASCKSTEARREFYDTGGAAVSGCASPFCQSFRRAVSTTRLSRIM